MKTGCDSCWLHVFKGNKLIKFVCIRLLHELEKRKLVFLVTKFNLDNTFWLLQAGRTGEL